MNLNKTLQEYQTLVNNQLEFFFSMKVNEKQGFVKDCVQQAWDYTLAGGKRLRPILMIMAYLGCGGKDKEYIVKKSIAVELFHNSTLVHDDIMDEDDKRRNQIAVHKYFETVYDSEESNRKLFTSNKVRFGVVNGICVGNLLMGYGSEVLDDNKALRIYDKTVESVNEGQILDNLFESKDVTLEDYLDMSSRKTASLMKASVQIGAVLANVSDDKVELIGDYAYNAAIAFQLKDDLMDIDTSSRKGRELGSDIRNGKKTLLVIEAGLTDNPIFGKSNATDEEIVEFIAKLKDAKVKVEALAIEYVDKAKDSLLKAQLHKEQEEFFMQLADYMVGRKS